MRRSSTKAPNRVREITSQLDVPTFLTPVSDYLLFFHFVCCVEKVTDLINLPVVSLLDTRSAIFSNLVIGSLCTDSFSDLSISLG